MLGYFLSGGIAFGLSYWITGARAPLWRVIAGALLAHLIGWFFGTAIAALVLEAIGVGLTAFDRVIGQNFWFAVAGAWYGAHRARKKPADVNTAVAEQVEALAPVRPNTDAAYAEALAEINEGRVDKGTWARCYAVSDGDESKTKARYIKARASAIQAASLPQ